MMDNGTARQRHQTGAAIRILVVVSYCLLLFLVTGADAENSVSVGADQALCVTVFKTSQVSGDRILLEQMAEITGGTEALRRNIARIDLGPAPRPGQERRMTGSAIAVAIKNAGVVWDADQIRIPDPVVVTGACQKLSEASLEEAFKRYVAQSAGEDEVVLSRIVVRGGALLPPGPITLTPLENARGDVKGKTTLRLAVAVAGEDCGQVTVSGWVDRYVQVVCAARTVSRDTVLSAEDLCLERMNIAKAPDRLVFDVGEAVGKRVRSTLQAGKCLQQHKLFEVPLVEKGDRVKLLVSAGPVSISTLGIAKADGGAGDQIRVENASSQKTVVGRIVDASTVEVLF